jgi:endonuclease/exonuclease/phosphatase family metal-dependent hydrolase
VDVIHAYEPDVVTLNEICDDDVDALGRALAEVHTDQVVTAFQPARDRRTGEAYRCVRNGRPYGVGLLARVAEHGHVTRGGIYSAQDPEDPEMRAWLCVSTAALHACTTHLAYTSATVALAQCRYLLEVAVPALPGRLPTVLGADLNLRWGGSPDLRSCLPDDYLRVDDGGVQQVVMTTDFTIVSSRLIDMDSATDHPSLLVSLGYTQARAALP